MNKSLILCAALFAGCAGTPPSTPPAAPARVAPSTGPTAAAASASAGSPSASFLAGYRRTVKDGVEYFCNTSDETGSKLHKKEACYTRETLVEMERGSQQEIHDMNRGYQQGGQDTAGISFPY
ncbi:MAG: hypothetical protein ABI616_08595 [Pseudomonadota bacterium]